jgi:hypothetical protein
MGHPHNKRPQPYDIHRTKKQFFKSGGLNTHFSNLFFSYSREGLALFSTLDNDNF